MLYLVGDIETYPNYFSCTLYDVPTEEWFYYELSSRRDDIRTFIKDLMHFKRAGRTFVGYNNIGFDYPIIHKIVQTRAPSNFDIYYWANNIIRGTKEDKFRMRVWENNWILPQLDLYKIHHFDNKARATSLKKLEIAMQLPLVEDLPFKPGSWLTYDQMDLTGAYNAVDVAATYEFLMKSEKQIETRVNLSEQYGFNCLNLNDTAIGKKYFINRLEESNPGMCYEYNPGKGRKPKQSHYDQIDLGDLIFDYIEFETEGLKDALHAFQSKSLLRGSNPIITTKGAFTGVTANIGGVECHFGLGGVHGSVERKIVKQGQGFILKDIDVASFYPNLAIQNNLYPRHLSEEFCRAYIDVYKERQGYPKKEFPVENLMLKLALNGVYGDSGSPYSVFYDPAYMLSITINGQLLICRLAEVLAKHNRVQLIQVNTDGLTVRIPIELEPWVDDVCRWWEDMTRLELESAYYSRMFIRDVNNYIAESSKDGSLKSKGAYVYNFGPTEWHKDRTAMVVAKAAEASLVNGCTVEEFIDKHDNIYDFCHTIQVRGRSESIWYGDQELSYKILRAFISRNGAPITIKRPPTGKEGAYKRKNKLDDDYYRMILAECDGGFQWDERIHTKNMSKYEWRTQRVCGPYEFELAQDLRGRTDFAIDRKWYIEKAADLVNLDVLHGS